MTQKPAGKGKELMRAFTDLVILALLITASGFGGYMYGVHQKLAPVQNVPPGTPGAVSLAPSSLPPPVSHTSANGGSAQSTSASAAAPATKHRYWLSSSGSEYIGYQIIVKVNDTPVDSFYGPGKTMDITNLVKAGKNDVTFEAKALGPDYNKHAGDEKSVLTVQVVNGASIQENYKPSDVLATYQRNAADQGDASDTVHFNGN